MTNENILAIKRIRVKITKYYHQEPVISRLVSDYSLTVNIKAAFLGKNAIGDGWFDLDLQGTEAQIQNGLAYLQELELEIWDEHRIGNW
ncbi:NIL domain-containing protein [Anabaena sp. WFMT]|uniref:NIL domain-containing protein n=1 Tax=Anabaena sp. WFMT TaxID=3449730 RepID=UPI003F24C02F